MAQMTRRRSGLLEWVPLIVGVAAALFVGWVVFPGLMYVEKPQPMNFSHAKHGKDVDLECAGCHMFRPDGSFSGIPRIANCAQCHETPNSESPSEALLISDYVSKDQEIPWRVYSRQPICVYFAHAPHVKMANISCETCHGPKQEENVLPPYEKNWLTGYSRNIWGWRISGLKTDSWDRMKMDDCAECHRERHAPSTCFVCHK